MGELYLILFPGDLVFDHVRLAAVGLEKGFLDMARVARGRRRPRRRRRSQLPNRPQRTPERSGTLSRGTSEKRVGPVWKPPGEPHGAEDRIPVGGRGSDVAVSGATDSPGGLREGLKGRVS